MDSSDVAWMVSASTCIIVGMCNNLLVSAVSSNIILHDLASYRTREPNIDLKSGLILI